MDKFTEAFFKAALFSTNDETTESGGEPLDKNYSVQDIDNGTLVKLAAECAQFQMQNANLLSGLTALAVSSEVTDELFARAGHDFWMTRNQHGCGFWDGDWPEPQATKLTESSHTFKEVNLYVGDDGKIYAMGYE